MLTEKTLILLNNVRFYAYHGVLPQERKVGAWFSVSLKIDYPFEQAVESDDLAHTLSYESVFEVVKREMAVPSNLLEHVAGRVLGELFKAFPHIRWAEVAIKKDNPPLRGDTSGAEIVMSAKNEKC